MAPSTVHAESAPDAAERRGGGGGGGGGGGASWAPPGGANLNVTSNVSGPFAGESYRHCLMASMALLRNASTKGLATTSSDCGELPRRVRIVPLKGEGGGGGGGG